VCSCETGKDISGSLKLKEYIEWLSKFGFLKELKSIELVNPPNFNFEIFGLVGMWKA
jgi:hypothetical protein